MGKFSPLPAVANLGHPHTLYQNPILTDRMMLCMGAVPSCLHGIFISGQSKPPVQAIERKISIMKNVYRQSSCQCTQTANQTNQTSYQPGFSLAMSYVLMQPWEQPYDLKTGLSRGTVFPGLDKPFLGRRVCCRG